MIDILPKYPCGILIYGKGKNGKTTVCYRLINLLESLAGKILDKYIITSSDGYDHIENCTINFEYNPENIQNWINEKKGLGVVIFDDFMHINLNKYNTHLSGLISTARKSFNNCYFIFSAHKTSIGKFLRDLCSCYIFFIIIDDVCKSVINNYIYLKKEEFNSIKRCLINNKYTFLILNSEGDYKLIELKLS